MSLRLCFLLVLSNGSLSTYGTAIIGPFFLLYMYVLVCIFFFTEQPFSKQRKTDRTDRSNVVETVTSFYFHRRAFIDGAEFRGLFAVVLGVSVLESSTLRPRIMDPRLLSTINYNRILRLSYTVTEKSEKSG